MPCRYLNSRFQCGFLLSAFCYLRLQGGEFLTIWFPCAKDSPKIRRLGDRSCGWEFYIMDLEMFCNLQDEIC